MGGYSFRLRDDEDEDLNSLIDPRALADLQPTAAEMAPSPQRSAPQSSFMPERDPELEQAWKGLEMQKIQEAQKPEYGWGEAARDIIPTGAALLLDGLVNKGRGAGAIVQGGMGEVARQEALRNKERLDAGELASKLHGRGQDAASAARLQYQYDALHARENAAGGVQGRYDLTRNDKNDPNSPRNNTARGMSYDLAYGRAQGAGDEKHDTNDRTADDRGIVRGAETKAELAARHEGAPLANADAADRSGREASASTTARLAAEHEGAPTAIADAASRASAVAEAQLPTQKDLKTTVTPGDTRADASQRAALSDQFTKESNYDRGMAAQIDRLDRVVSKYPEGQRALPGVGFGAGIGGEANDSLRGLLTDFGISDQSDALEMRNAQKTLAELAQRKESGAAGPEAERARYLARVGSQPNASEAQFRVGLKAARDLVHMNLGAFSAGKADAARGVMQGAGLDGWLPDDQPQPGAVPPPTAAPPPGAGMPGYSHDGLPPGPNLGDTGGERLRDVPPSPTGNVTRIRKPDGTVIESRMSLDELAGLPEDWELVR